MACSKGLLKSNRTHDLAKTATRLVIGSELAKASWSISANIKHFIHDSNPYIISPESDGKIATAKKFGVIALATATHDMEPGRQRSAIAWTALGLAISATVDTANNLQNYQTELNQLLSE